MGNAESTQVIPVNGGTVVNDTDSPMDTNEALKLQLAQIQRNEVAGSVATSEAIQRSKTTLTPINMNNFRSSRLMRPEELNELEKWTIVTPIRPVYVQLDKIGMCLLRAERAFESTRRFTLTKKSIEFVCVQKYNPIDRLGAAGSNVVVLYEVPNEYVVQNIQRAIYIFRPERNYVQFVQADGTSYEETWDELRKSSNGFDIRALTLFRNDYPSETKIVSIQAGQKQKTAFPLKSNLTPEIGGNAVSSFNNTISTVETQNSSSAVCKKPKKTPIYSYNHQNEFINNPSHRAFLSTVHHDDSDDEHNYHENYATPPILQSQSQQRQSSSSSSKTLIDQQQRIENAEEDARKQFEAQRRRQQLLDEEENARLEQQRLFEEQQRAIREDQARVLREREEQRIIMLQQQEDARIQREEEERQLREQEEQRRRDEEESQRKEEEEQRRKFEEKRQQQLRDEQEAAAEEQRRQQQLLEEEEERRRQQQLVEEEKKRSENEQQQEIARRRQQEEILRRQKEEIARRQEEQRQKQVQQDEQARIALVERERRLKELAEQQRLEREKELEKTREEQRRLDAQRLLIIEQQKQQQLAAQQRQQKLEEQRKLDQAESQRKQQLLIEQQRAQELERKRLREQEKREQEEIARLQREERERERLEKIRNPKINPKNPKSPPNIVPITPDGRIMLQEPRIVTQPPVLPLSTKNQKDRFSKDSINNADLHRAEEEHLQHLQNGNYLEHNVVSTSVVASPASVNIQSEKTTQSNGKVVDEEDDDYIQFTNV